MGTRGPAARSARTPAPCRRRRSPARGSRPPYGSRPCAQHDLWEMPVKEVTPRREVVRVVTGDEPRFPALVLERLRDGAVVLEVLLAAPDRNRQGDALWHGATVEHVADEARDAAEAAEPGLVLVVALAEEAGRLQEQAACHAVLPV